MTTRAEKLDMLKKYYCENLVEDKIKGTNFDNSIFDTIDFLTEQWVGVKKSEKYLGDL